MKWMVLSKGECEGVVSTLPQSFQQDELAQDYLALRTDLKTIADNVRASIPEAKEYAFDIAFAVPAYMLLNRKYGMNERLASNDGIWRYLSVKVIPDVVFMRWGRKDARFWKEPRRIWLKALWWYVYLSWQGSEEKTYSALSNNTTDILVQLVERPGPRGYRVSVCRQIMYKLSVLPVTLNKAEQFRKIMVLNTARLKVVEPELYPKGEQEYVGQLFAYFNIA